MIENTKMYKENMGKRRLKMHSSWI